MPNKSTNEAEPEDYNIQHSAINRPEHTNLFVLVAQLPSRRRIEAVAHTQKRLAHSFSGTNHWLEYGNGHGANHSFERSL